MKHPWPKTV